ncbi:cytochrome P450 4V3 [Apodospora peruviana]|uniref:Cytochrome P450 4V3 n=1 Tax=Apodospora peruviana TaxID=516989 RepID=A0AAE0LYF6_9PEZI|nr:cytochrome P450 4V3 [Apodospora peruviana]
MGILDNMRYIRSLGGPWAPVIQIAGAFVVYKVTSFLYNLVKCRARFQRMKASGIPIMPHSLLFGHLLVVAKLTKGYPSDMHPNYIADLIWQNWRTLFPSCKSCPSIFYVDLWPMGPPIAFTIDPTTATQAFTTHELGRTKAASRYLYPIAHGRDMASLEGPDWKLWRSRFNQGFSSKNLTALIPSVIEEVVVFRDILRQKIGKDDDGNWGEAFQLEPLTTSLTFDVIGRAALDIRLHNQTKGPDPLQSALQSQMGMAMFTANIGNLHRQLSPIRHYKMTRNLRIMRDFLLPYVNSCLSESSVKTSSKTILDLAVQAVRNEKQLSSLPLENNDGLVEDIMAQLKIFIFAGFDTTANAICWTLHMLPVHPVSASKVRAELDQVFGPDPDAMIAALQSQPQLLNQLPYTLGFIKETFRFFPSVGQNRENDDGEFEFTVSEPPKNVTRPTRGFMVWAGVRAAMRLEQTWYRGNEFLPERWLVTDPNDPLHPPKNAWHPFGLGPRACIGQELALSEIKLALAVVVREMEVECAWDQWDQQMEYKNLKRGKKDMIDGHRCYQTGDGTPHTKDGMPVHMRRLRRDLC